MGGVCCLLSIFEDEMSWPLGAREGLDPGKMRWRWTGDGRKVNKGKRLNKSRG